MKCLVLTLVLSGEANALLFQVLDNSPDAVRIFLTAYCTLGSYRREFVVVLEVTSKCLIRQINDG